MGLWLGGLVEERLLVVWTTAPADGLRAAAGSGEQGEVDACISLDFTVHFLLPEEAKKRLRRHVMTWLSTRTHHTSDYMH